MNAFLHNLVVAAPLLAALELIVGFRLLVTRPHPSRALTQRDRRTIGFAFVTAAVIWAGLAVALRGNNAAMLAAGVPWLAVVVLGVLVILWRRRPIQVADALRVLTDPTRLQQLPSDMRPLVGRVRSLARRITVVGAVEATLRALFIGSVVAAIWLLVDRVLTDTAMDLLTGLLAAPILAPAGGMLAGWWLSRATPVEAAVRADIVLNLRERLSTALSVDGTSDFEVAVRRDAVDQLRTAQWAEVAPMKWPWQAPATLAVGALLVAGALWLPAWRLLDQPAKTNQPSVALHSNAAKAVQILNTNRLEMHELAEAVGTKELKDLMDKVNKLIEDLSSRPNPNESMSPEEQKKRIQQLSELEDQAEQLRKQLEALGRDADRLAEQQRQRDQNGGGNNGNNNTPFDKLQDKLSKQDMKGAADALKDLKEQMDKADKDGSGQSDKDLQKQGEKLKEMADQLDKDNPLKQQLQKLGDQLKNYDKMSPQQKQQMKQQMQQLQQQMQNMQGNGQMNQQMLQMMKDQLGGARQQFGQCPGGPDGQQPQPQGGNGGAKPGESSPFNPGDNEKQRKELMDMLNQSQGKGDGQGQGNGRGQNPGQQPGNGTGDRGRGGGTPGEDKPLADHEKLPWLQRGPLHRGDIISAMRRMGIPDSGEARTQFESAWRSARRQAEDGMSRQSLPPEYRPLARRYFDSIHPGGSGGGDD